MRRTRRTTSGPTRNHCSRDPFLAQGRDYDEIVFSDNGIGFALCRKVVTHHQGIIRADSKVDEDASVTVILPYSQHLPA